MRWNGLLAGALALPLVLASAARAQDFSASLDAAAERSMLSGIYVFGEFLYVWPTRDDLRTAILANGNAESLSWSGAPGFRVGVGYQVLDTSWDVGASFAYFHAKSQRTVAAPDGSALTAVLTTNPAVRGAAEADGDAGMSYGVLDLDVGKAIALDESCGLRLFGGVRLAAIDQSFKCIYSGGAMGENTDFVNAPVHFQGAGVSAGAESNWDIYRGWGLFGKARLALIAGRFSSLRTETLGSATIGDISNTLDTVVPVAELQVGLHYQGERCFFSAGCDLSNWFNMVNGLAAPDAAGVAARRQGNLTLEAVTVKVGFVF